MRNQLGLLLLMLCIGVSSAEAANIKVLLPIVLQSPVAGAFGSLWASRVTILNVSDHPFFVTGFSPPCGFDSCVQPELAPGLTTPLSPGNVVGDVPATFLLVDATERNNLKVELRVQDLSRQADTWGTEIPVIDEARAAQQTVQLLAVPLDPTFRSLVRVYDFDPAPGHSVMIRIFKPDELQVKHDELLKEISVPLKIPISTKQNPGYAQLAVNGLPELSSNGTVRIEVSPSTPGLRFWAFASVTNNETQHVTIVTPQ